jgi:uncharacterized protein YdcH (DUF465 family)
MNFSPSPPGDSIRPTSIHYTSSVGTDGKAKEADTMTRDSVKEELLQTDDEFRRLHEDHQECERRLIELRQGSLLSQEDEIQLKRIKLHKLMLKDRMEEILRTRRETSQISA